MGCRSTRAAATRLPGTPADPLVTSAAEGFSGWFNRVFKLIGAHLRDMYVIGLLSMGVPVAVLSTLLSVYAPTSTQHIDEQGRAVPEFHFPHPVAFLLILLMLVVVGGFLGALGQAALVWTVTRRAAGAPAPVADALRYGLANAARLWGWTLIYGLLVTVGVCACVVGSLYFALAGCLYLPVALYQRGANPISTSFSMIHKNFGRALGRMALLVLIVGGASFVLQIPAAIATAAGGATAGHLVSGVLALVGLPLNFALLLGEVLLFAELRARQAPLTTADLNAVL